MMKEKLKRFLSLTGVLLMYLFLMAYIRYQQEEHALLIVAGVLMLLLVGLYTVVCVTGKDVAERIVRTTDAGQQNTLMGRLKRYTARSGIIGILLICIGVYYLWIAVSGGGLLHDIADVLRASGPFLETIVNALSAVRSFLKGSSAWWIVLGASLLVFQFSLDTAERYFRQAVIRAEHEKLVGNGEDAWLCKNCGMKNSSAMKYCAKCSAQK